MKSETSALGNDKWIALPVTSSSLSNGSALVLKRDSNRVRLLSEESLRLLRSCDRMRTIDEHAARLLDQPSSQSLRESSGDTLERLAKNGFLVSRETILENLMRSASRSPETGTGISTVVWPTRNRPTELCRSVSDWVAVCRAHARSVGFLVCDDSGPDESTARDSLEAVVRGSDSTIHFLGAREKGQAVQAMVDRGLSPDTVAFALNGEQSFATPFGLNRNWLLLATAGELFLSVDDDTMCRFAEPAGARRGLAFDHSPYPVDIRFFRSRREALASAPYVEEDPIAPHEALLGRRASCLVSSIPEEERRNTLDRLSGDFAYALLTDDPTVGVTTVGTFGESGGVNPRLIFDLDGRLRERLSGAGNYEDAIGSTEILSGAVQTTLVQRSNLVSMCFAADNRDVLPPTLPIGRGEDTLWGLTVPMCAPQLVSAHLPRAVLHLGRPRQLTRRDAIDYRFALFHCFQSVTNAFSPPYRESGTRRLMERLGTFFVDLAQADWVDFEAFLRLQWANETTKTIDYLESLLLIHNRQPANWAADVDAHIESLHRYAVSEDFAIPAELRTYPDGRPRPREEARRMLQEYVRKYGELLIAWPDMVSVAKELKAAERFPLTRLG